MANHGFVKTKKHMKPEAITALLDELNESHFKGNLKIEYHLADEGDTSVYGPHCWLLKYESNDQVYAKRVCWLNNRQSWEIRHGGGGDFAWWIDSTITNEVACQFNGTISDGGHGDRWKGEPNKYPEFLDYLKMKHHQDQSEDHIRAMMQMACEFGVPPEHMPDLGEKIEIKFEFEQEDGTLSDTPFDYEELRVFQQESLSFEVSEIMHKALKQSGMRRVDLAVKLGKDRNYVTQLLAGMGNPTLRTIADVFTALGQKLSVRIDALDIDRPAEVSDD